MKTAYHMLDLDGIIKLDTGAIMLAGGTIGAIMEKLYGKGGTDMMYFLILLLVLDLTTGTAAAKKEGVETSEYGLKGLTRVGVLALLPGAMHYLDSYMDTNGFLFYAITFGIAYHTFKSFTANMVRCGWDRYIPMGLINYLESEIQSKIMRSENRYESLKYSEEQKAKHMEKREAYEQKRIERMKRRKRRV